MTIAFPIPNLPIGRLREWWRAQWAVPRARAAVFVLMFVVGLSGLLFIDARDREVRQELAEKHLLVSRTERIGPAELWQQRRVETDSLRYRAEERLWEGETDGLAQANFQSWIADQVSLAGIRVGDIHTTISPANGPLKLRRMSTQFSGRFDADAFFKLLEVIATQQRLIVVDQLEIQLGQVPRFDMTVSGYLGTTAKPKGG